MRSKLLCCAILMGFVFCYLVKAQKIQLSINKTFANKDVTINPFQGNEKIYSLKLTGSITLNSDSSLIRIILIDNNQKEYLIYEAYPILSGLGKVNFSDTAEETEFLNGLIPSLIKVQLTDATCLISSFSIDQASKSNIMELQVNHIKEVNLNKVKKIQEQIHHNGMIWSAWLTPYASLSYQEKEKIFGDKYNTHGFEYYKDGFFQSTLKFVPSNPSSSVIVNHWDWRSRHRANNPVTANGNPNDCYYDNDLDGSGWMTPPRYQDGCWLNGQLQPIPDPQCSTLGGQYRGAPTCWAFSPANITEGLENLYFNSQLDPYISVQDIVMCSGWEYNPGWMTTALDYLKNYGAVDNACYPYVAAPTPCADKCLSPVEVTSIQGYYTEGYYGQIYPTDHIKTLLIENGPITIIPYFGHTDCVVGYDIIKEGDYIDQLGGIRVPPGSPYIGQTYWIDKNTSIYIGLGTNHVSYNYTLDVPMATFCMVTLPIISSTHPESEIRVLDCDGDGYYNWGIGPKPANCPPGVPDEEDCDDTDPMLRGQDPVSHECMLNCAHFNYVDVPEVISTNTIWFYDQWKDHNVIVQSGNTLTIKSKIGFVSQAKLIVQPGAMLVINGGTLTSGCNAAWQGVEVWGHANLSQNTINQGRINVINGGQIENAEIGILSGKRQNQTGSTFDDTQSGGMVWASDGVFKNNYIGIHFRPYTQFSSNPSFHLCAFTTGPDIIDINQFDGFIKVSDITSVTASGCSFINSFSTDPKGTGLYATGSGVHVGAYCNAYIVPCPEPNLEHCTFTNLSRGIYAVNTPGSHGISVAYSDFSAVQYGLYLSAFSSAYIVLNTFNIPEPAGPPQISGPYGMYLDNCTLYNVEGNTFFSTATIPTTIGLVVNNSGSDANVIYRNTFYGLKYSTIAEYANRNPYPNTDGLCYVCNNFKSTNVSIGVVFDGTLQSNYGIAAYQNATFNGIIVPTFNLFYNLGTPLPNFDIYNTNCNAITRYYFPPNYNQLNGYSYYPYYRSSNVTPYPSLINFSNQCPNTINYGGTQNQDLPQGEDDTKTKVDSLIKSYKLRNTIESYYELAFLYLQYKETELAEATIQDIPKQFSFTQEDQKTYVAFKDLFKICKDFRTSPVSSLNLSSIQTSELKSINENCHNSIGAYARNLLIAAREINYQEPIILPVLNETTTANDQDEDGLQSLSDYFKIRPNPASNYFIVDYDLSSKSGSSAMLKVYSTLGKLVEEEALKPEKGKRLINTEKWVPGLYLVTLEIEGTIVQSSKISITK